MATIVVDAQTNSCHGSQPIWGDTEEGRFLSAWSFCTKRLRTWIGSSRAPGDLLQDITSRSIYHPTDNLSNFKCCIPFWSNGDDISCSLDDRCHYRDSQVGSLVYHLLQSVYVPVNDLFFKGYPWDDFRRKSYCIWFDIQIFCHDKER